MTPLFCTCSIQRAALGCVATVAIVGSRGGSQGSRLALDIFKSSAANINKVVRPGHSHIHAILCSCLFKAKFVLLDDRVVYAHECKECTWNYCPCTCPKQCKEIIHIVKINKNFHGLRNCIP